MLESYDFMKRIVGVWTLLWPLSAVWRWTRYRGRQKIPWSTVGGGVHLGRDDTVSRISKGETGISHSCSRWLKEGLGAFSGWPRIYGHLGLREDMIPSVGFGDQDRLDSFCERLVFQLRLFQTCAGFGFSQNVF